MTWLSGVVMAMAGITAILINPITGDPITGDTDMDMDIDPTTTGLTTGLITIHMDTIAGPMDSGLAAITKNRKRMRAEARGSGGASDHVASASELHTNVAIVYIHV